jgi:exonuclease VII small subunit
MKNENILETSKSKSLKEVKEEINQILEKLESQETNLSESVTDYARLIRLNKYVDLFFKKKNKEISTIGKKIKKTL